MNNNCKQIESLIALAASDDLSPTERQQVDKHVETCGECKRLYAELRELRTKVAALKECESPTNLTTQPTASPLRTVFPGMITAIIAVVVVASFLVFRTNTPEPARTAKSEPAPAVAAAHHVVPKIAPPPPPRSALAGLAQEPGISKKVLATINTKDPDIVILWMGN